MTQQPVRITGPLLDVLEAFLAAGGDELHGWAIIKATKRGGPTVYKILERLADMGWVVARWESQRADASVPRRRYYQLTTTGTAQARALILDRRPALAGRQVRPALGGGVL